jgi:hypothetical protein
MINVRHDRDLHGALTSTRKSEKKKEKRKGAVRIAHNQINYVCAANKSIYDRYLFSHSRSSCLAYSKSIDLCPKLNVILKCIAFVFQFVVLEIVAVFEKDWKTK